MYYLHKHGLTIHDHFEDARKKEGGLDPAMISYILARMQIEEVPDYVLAPFDLNDFKVYIASLQQDLAEMAYPGG